MKVMQFPWIPPQYPYWGSHDMAYTLVAQIPAGPSTPPLETTSPFQTSKYSIKMPHCDRPPLLRSHILIHWGVLTLGASTHHKLHLYTRNPKSTNTHYKECLQKPLWAAFSEIWSGLQGSFQLPQVVPACNYSLQVPGMATVDYFPGTMVLDHHQ